MPLFDAVKQADDCESIDLGKRRLFSLGRARRTQTAVNAVASPRKMARPPYAVDEALFARLCDGCGQCAKACPNNIISVVNGIAALDVNYAVCSLCQHCQVACPTLALSSTVESTGLIATISNSCENVYSYCASCEDSCPFDALQWQEGGKPSVDAQKCKGCAQCGDSCYTGVISYRLI